jgi:hypothetical protein
MASGDHKMLHIIELQAAIVVLGDDKGNTYKIGRKQIHSLLNKDAEEIRARICAKD